MKVQGAWGADRITRCLGFGVGLGLSTVGHTVREAAKAEREIRGQYEFMSRGSMRCQLQDWSLTGP